MAECKHTPGPWEMTTVRTSCGVCHKIGPWPHKRRAGSEMSACIYDDYPSPPEGTDTMLANARLITAAPELLEIAKRILDRGYVSQSIEEERDDHLALVAAISKAEGRIHD